MYEEFVAQMQRIGRKVQTGVFGADMKVALLTRTSNHY
jgi:D-Tyr-tRNAtyr deacylase